MTTTIVLSALFGGVVASYPLLKWGRFSKDALDKIERLCVWVLFPLVAAGIEWLLFAIYPRSHAILLLAIVLAIIAALAIYVLADLFDDGLLVLLVLVTFFAYLLLFLLDRFRIWQFMLIVIVVNILLVFLVARAMKCFRSLRQHAMLHSIATTILVGVLVSEGALASAAAGSFPLSEPLLCSWIGGKRAVPILFIALRNGDDKVREDAVWAMGESHDKSTIPALTAALGDSSNNVRGHSAVALIKLGAADVVVKAGPKVVRAMVVALEGSDEWVCKGGMDVVVKIGQPAIRELINALTDNGMEGDWNRHLRERKIAIEALGKIGQPAVPDLINLLKSSNHWDSSGAALALGKTGDKYVVPALIDALKSSDHAVRDSAADALGEIGDKSAIPALEATHHLNHCDYCQPVCSFCIALHRLGAK